MPIGTIVVVSFWDYDFARIIPDFVWTNYEELLVLADHLEDLSQTRCSSPPSSGRSAWSIGFTVAYFLAFHVASPTMQMVLFLVCTVPFLTSNIIRMISWIPFLGRNGLLNSALVDVGIDRRSRSSSCSSPISPSCSPMVHLYTLFMVVPIFNTLMRIDRSLIEAARDAGASDWQMLCNVIIPLAKPGIAIGSIFVVTLVMGDFVDRAVDVRRPERLGRR